MNGDPAMTGTKALGRALDLLRSVATDEDRRPLTQHAAALDIPTSTAHRLAATFVDRGLLVRVGRGRYVGGGALADLARQPLRRDSLVAIARPLIARLSHQTDTAAHLGVWDQEMVQYLVRVAPAQSSVFTREGQRLEGYCSAIGKILLAHLSEIDREYYLDNGPFVALTSHTITDPALLRTELAEVRATDIAIDRQEIAEGLTCIAAPVRRRDREVVAAVSLSGVAGVAQAEEKVRRCAEAIGRRLS